MAEKLEPPAQDCDTAVMALTLDADGKQIVQPGDADIAQAFQALDRGTGFFAGPGISIITLARDEAHSLSATGTAADGFMLGYTDGDPDCEYCTDLDHPVHCDEAVRLFQAYAHGEDSWRANYQWERMVLAEGSTPRLIKRLLVIGILGYVAYLVVRKLLAN